jgi:single-strand DNA-binding protein
MHSTVTLFGNLVDDVRLRETATTRVASFRIAMNERWFDKRLQRWNERTTYINVSAWRQLAENLAASLHKGQPVVVVGRLRQHEYDVDGRHVVRHEVDADIVGHDLSRGSAVFARNPRGPQTAELAQVHGDEPALAPVGWGVPGAADAGSAPGPRDPFDVPLDPARHEEPAA